MSEAATYPHHYDADAPYADSMDADGIDRDDKPSEASRNEDQG